MEKYSRYYGTVLFIIIVGAAIFLGYTTLTGAITGLSTASTTLEQKEVEYNRKLEEKKVVERKLEQMRNDSAKTQKKLYAPADNDLGNDTLFFTLYNDLMEMIHANSIKIKTMTYAYNPEEDAFVKYSKSLYFVSDVEMQLVSNYTQLGKFIQDVIQYPYYMRIMNLEVEPYTKDKKILISKMVIRLYARTSPDPNTETEEE